MKLDASFYRRADVQQVARELLGKRLVVQSPEGRTSGIIVETEAYEGVTDRASHAYNGRRTARTAIMYLPGGVAYVYLIYGIHALFNVVTHDADVPHAVLVRALEPAEGADLMLQRRRLDRRPDGSLPRNLTNGPGLLTQALGISTRDTGTSLLTGRIWMEDSGTAYTADQIVASARVGVDYAGADALLPYRYRVAGNPWTSPAK